MAQTKPPGATLALLCHSLHLICHMPYFWLSPPDRSRIQSVSPLPPPGPRHNLPSWLWRHSLLTGLLSSPSAQPSSYEARTGEPLKQDDQSILCSKPPSPPLPCRQIPPSDQAPPARRPPSPGLSNLEASRPLLDHGTGFQAHVHVWFSLPKCSSLGPLHGSLSPLGQDCGPYLRREAHADPLLKTGPSTGSSGPLTLFFSCDTDPRLRPCDSLTYHLSPFLFVHCYHPSTQGRGPW